MEFHKLTNILNTSIQQDLPGVKAHQLLSPLRMKEKSSYIPKSDAQKAGVMVLIYPINNKAHLVLTQRHPYPGVHGGQISFPGGKQDPEDSNLKDTALRETFEELGVLRSEIEVLGELSPIYIPPSNFHVQPLLGLSQERPNFVKEEAEVASILDIPLHTLLQTESLQSLPVNIRGYERHVPCFKVNEHIIWGATAIVISELLYMIRNS